MEGAKDMTQESVAGSVQPKLSREEQRLDKGVVSSVQQGFDASAETVGTYHLSGFTPTTFTALEQTFKSSATAKPSLVSMQTGVSVDVIAEIFSDLWHHL